MQKVSANRKLVFMYLANDVIQNSKRKGPEYSESFSHVLTKAFKDISQQCDDEKIISSLMRILQIWEDRGVYDGAKIKDFTDALKSCLKGDFKSSSDDTKKRKIDDSSVQSGISNNGTDKKKSKIASNQAKDRVKSEIVEVNGTVETHVTLSPHFAAQDPPEPEELIKMLSELEDAASSDAATREKITNLPPEILDKDILAKLEDKDSALKLLHKVNDAVQLLKDYNSRLSSEMSDRNKVTTMLKEFQREQQELLAQAEQRLEEYSKKIIKIREVQKEIKKHLKNLPDLASLPDVTGGGLAPLPSAGDLFNVHHH